MLIWDAQQDLRPGCRDPGSKVNLNPGATLDLCGLRQCTFPKLFPYLWNDSVIINLQEFWGFKDSMKSIKSSAWYMVGSLTSQLQPIPPLEGNPGRRKFCRHSTPYLLPRMGESAPVGWASSVEWDVEEMGHYISSSLNTTSLQFSLSPPMTSTKPGTILKNKSGTARDTASLFWLRAALSLRAARKDSLLTQQAREGWHLQGECTLTGFPVKD